MKFQIKHDPSGAYVNSEGVRLTITPSVAGKDYTDIENCASDLKLIPNALYAARQKKVNQLQIAYEKALSAGITQNGITLAAEQSDQTAFNHLITLLREAEELQPDDASKTAFLATTQTITDIHGGIHTISVTQFRALIVGYGNAIYTLRTALVGKLQQVAAANTVNDIEAIS